MILINFSKIKIDSISVSKMLYANPGYVFRFISSIPLYLKTDFTREKTRIIFFRIYDMLI